MEIIIPQDIIQKSTKCSKNVRCLSDVSHDLCQAICSMNKDVLFVKCVEGKDCSYFEPHDKIQLCTCPVRKEIYRRYHL